MKLHLMVGKRREWPPGTYSMAIVEASLDEFPKSILEEIKVDYLKEDDSLVDLIFSEIDIPDEKIKEWIELMPNKT